MAVSITIDGTEINDTNLGVRLHGQVVTSRSGDNQALVVSGLLTGDDNDDLNDKWAALKDLTVTENKDVRVKIDTDATSFYEEYYVGKTTGQTSIARLRTQVTADSTRTGTLTTIPFLLSVSSSDLAQSVGGGVGTVTEFEGQIDNWKLLQVYSQANIQTKIFNITFGSIDGDATGLGAYTSVDSNGGQAQFNFGSGALSGITLSAGMRLDVSGTVYNGSYSVASISGDSVTVTASFISTDTGSAQIQEKETGEELYQTHRSSILEDILDLGTDGAFNEDNNLILKGEHIETDGDRTIVTVEAGWISKDYNAVIRDINIAIDRAEVTTWPVAAEAGPRPITFAAAVNIVVDMEEHDAPPYEIWATVRDQVISDIKSDAGATDAIGPLEEEASWDKQSGSVAVKLNFLAKNVDVLSFSRVTVRKKTLDFMSWADAEGFDYVQTKANPNQVIVAVTATRNGVGLEYGNIDTPQESGYTFIEVDEEREHDDGMEREGMGTLYKTSITKVFRRFKLRGGSIAVRNPTTSGLGQDEEDPGTHAGQFG